MTNSKTEKIDDKSKRVTLSFLSLFQYSSITDKCLISCGILSAIILGAAMPAMVLVFGQMTDTFVAFASCVENENCTSGNQSSPSNFSIAEQKEQLSQDLEDIMTTFAYYYVIVACISMICGFFQVHTMLLSSSRQIRKIRQQYFRSIIRQELEWFDDKSVGEINLRLNEDVTKIREAIGDKFSYFINNISTFICALIIGFVNGWQLTLIIIGTTPILVCAYALSGKFITSWIQKEMQAYATAGSIVDNALKNIRTVVAYGAQDKEANRYYEKLGDAENHGVRKGMLLGTFQGFLWCLLLLAYALAFWYGSVLALNPELDFSIGRLITVCFSIILATFNLAQAAAAMDIFMTGRVAGAAVFEVIERKSSIDPLSNEGFVPDDVKGKISFINVNFNYQSRSQKEAINFMNTTLHPGKMYALAGASGTGKTTLLKLMQRLYDPRSGKVMLDGRDIRTINVRWLRSKIGVVSQEPTLFATTILENIRLGYDGVLEEDIIEASKFANAYDFIMDLPEKFETLVGVDGCQLSGGQKQRIAIARAIVRNPKILLLDQACSALDTHSEAIVLENLQKIKRDKTILLVAHRESTMKLADEVINAEEFVLSLDSNTMRRNGSPYSSAKNIEETKDPKDGCGIFHDGFQLEDEISGKNVKVNLEREKNEIGTETISKCEDLYDTIDYLSSNINGCENTLENDRKAIVPTTAVLDRKQKINENKNTEVASMSRILKMNSTEYPYIIFGSTGALLNGCVQPVFAVLLSAIIGVYALSNIDEKRDEINFYCLMMIIIAGASFIAQFLQHSMFAKSGEVLTRRVRKLTFSAILRQDISWFDRKENEAALLSLRLSQDAGLIQGAAGIQIGILVSIATSLALAIGIAFYSGWKLALLQVAFFPLFIASHGAKARMVQTSASRDNSALAKAGTIVSETVGSIETVAQIGKEEYFLKKYEETLNDIERIGKRLNVLQGIVFGFASSVIHFSYAATFRLGAYLIRKEEIDFESMFRVYFVIVFAGLALGRAYRYLPDYAEARKAAGRIFQLMDRKPVIDVNDTSGFLPKNIEGNLQLKSCEFTYATRPDCLVLNGVNIDVESGKTLALIGASGCGKSTIVQILERFYNLDEGVVMLDNKDIRSYNLKYMRSKIGVVFQDPSLFDGTLYDNIVYGDCGRHITYDDVQQAAKLANIHDFIVRLEKGYDTEVGCVGNRLSRGQKQRIAIARALVRNPSILLLDEATSSLDSDNEKIVQEALERARQGRTTILIAHRLSTIRNADKIAVISKGKVIECGNHDELIAMGGAYYNMINLNTNKSN
ncbi:bile salt export pump-like isoform X1 [Styela clava]